MHTWYLFHHEMIDCHPTLSQTHLQPASNPSDLRQLEPLQLILEPQRPLQSLILLLFNTPT